MPTTGRFLLDTNIVIAVLDGDQGAIANLALAPEVSIPAIVLGELLFGAAKSARAVENTAKVEGFAAGRSILSCDADVARAYGALRYRLRQRGRPIPENDLWIAATAVRHTPWQVGKSSRVKSDAPRQRRQVFQSAKHGRSERAWTACNTASRPPLVYLT